MNDTTDTTTKKLTLGWLASWGFGIFFALGAIGVFLGDSALPGMGLVCLGLALVLLPPVRRLVHQKTNRTLSTGVRAALIIGLLITGSLTVPQETLPETTQETAKQAAEQQNQPAPAPVAQPALPPAKAEAPPAPVETIEYGVIRGSFESMTDAQFKAFAKQQEGKFLVGRGYIEDVREKLFGGYEVWIDMDAPSEIVSVQEISFGVDEAAALALRKDQVVGFSGRIKSIMKVLGKEQITLEDVQLTGTERR